MKKVKMFIGLALAMALLCHSTSTVYAVTHKEGCTTSSYIVNCGQYVGTATMGPHNVYDTTNHYTVICSRSAERHLHTINCAYINCRVVLEANVQRVCKETHSYCGVLTALCQY